jgi:cytochrome P450
MNHDGTNTETTTSPHPRPELLADLIDRSPYDYYAMMRGKGDLVWDDSVKAWFAASYETAKTVFTDEDTYARPAPIDVVPSEKYVRIIGEAHSSGLKGEVRLEHRKWWLSLFSKQAVEAYRVGIITDVLDDSIDRFADLGHADLVADYCSRVSIRVIAGILGLPWRDDDWITRLRATMNARDRYQTLLYATPDKAREVADEALAASFDTDALLAPYIEAGRSRDDLGIMSRIWRDESLKDWSKAEIYSLVRIFFSAGSDTTRTAMSNALYLALTTEGLADTIRQADPRLLGSFIEESLRLYGTVHFRSRIVQRDVELAGVQLHPGDTVIGAMASADRDEKFFEDPLEVHLDRKNQRQHLAFSAGIGACAGAAMARVELSEGVARVLRRLPDIRLDSSGPPPVMVGHLFKLLMPINVVFTPVPVGTGPSETAA